MRKRRCAPDGIRPSDARQTWVFRDYATKRAMICETRVCRANMTSLQENGMTAFVHDYVSAWCARWVPKHIISSSWYNNIFISFQYWLSVLVHIFSSSSLLPWSHANYIQNIPSARHFLLMMRIRLSFMFYPRCAQRGAVHVRYAQRDDLMLNWCLMFHIIDDAMIIILSVIQPLSFHINNRYFRLFVRLSLSFIFRPVSICIFSSSTMLFHHPFNEPRPFSFFAFINHCHPSVRLVIPISRIFVTQRAKRNDAPLIYYDER